MFLPIFLLLVVTAASAPSGSSESEEYDHECLYRSSLTVEELESETADYTEEKLLCYTKCLFERRGFLDGDGILDVDAIEEHFEDSEDSEELINYECLKNLPRILECQDVLFLQDCISSIESNV